MSSGELLCSIVFDIGVTAVAMDAAEQSFFAGCADGSIYQVELFRRVSTLVLSVTNAMLTKTVQERSIFLLWSGVRNYTVFDKIAGL